MKRNKFKNIDPTRKLVFKNRKHTRITLYQMYDPRFPGGVDIMFSVRSRWKRRGNSDSMPVTLGGLLLTFSDFNNITKNVLKRDKVARRWFRRLVKNTVIDEAGTRLGDFILPNSQLDYNKIQAYESNLE